MDKDALMQAMAGLEDEGTRGGCNGRGHLPTRSVPTACDGGLRGSVPAPKREAYLQESG